MISGMVVHCLNNEPHTPGPVNWERGVHKQWSGCRGKNSSQEMFNWVSIGCADRHGSLKLVMNLVDVLVQLAMMNQSEVIDRIDVSFDSILLLS